MNRHNGLTENSSHACLIQAYFTRGSLAKACLSLSKGTPLLFFKKNRKLLLSAGGFLL